MSPMLIRGHDWMLRWEILGDCVEYRGGVCSEKTHVLSVRIFYHCCFLWHLKIQYVYEKLELIPNCIWNLLLQTKLIKISFIVIQKRAIFTLESLEGNNMVQFLIYALKHLRTLPTRLASHPNLVYTVTCLGGGGPLLPTPSYFHHSISIGLIWLIDFWSCFWSLYRADTFLCRETYILYHCHPFN